LADIDAVVGMGAEHITFIDADFFSTGKRGFGVVQQMKARHPSLTFDITARMDDMIRHQNVLGPLRELGCQEITSAFEYPDDSTLKILHKGITTDQLRAAVRIVQEAGIRLKPTFITYNPWANLEKMQDMEGLLKSLGINEPLDPMQAQTRLLLYKGSPLLKQAEIQNLKLSDRGTYYAWEHPDERVDDAYAELAGAGRDVRMRCCIKG
jgi:hopanoid C-3 methylase